MTIIYSHKPLGERKPNDFYKTPIELCRSALKILPEGFPSFRVLDPGCGDGVWGKAYREIKSLEDSMLIGVDIRDVGELPEYDKVHIGDFRNFYDPILGFNLVFGNPPYRFAEEFIDISLDVLREGGYLLFLLRLAFLESDKRYKKYYNSGLNPKEVYVSTRRISFTENKKSDNTAYGIYLWQKGWKGDTTLKWLNWTYD